MKKYIFLFVILNICAISTLHSQWLEKEGYWELEQNYGQLRDIKLNESTNELWIVTADYKVIAIDADTGLEIKRCECELDSGYLFANISNDLQSVIFAMYILTDSKSKSNINDITINVFKTTNCHKISVFVYNNNKQDNYYYQSASVNFADFISNTNLLVLGISQHAQWQGTGPNQHWGTIGGFLIYELNLDTFNLKFGLNRSSYYSTLSKVNNNQFYFTNGYSGGQSWTNSGGGGKSGNTSYLTKFNFNDNKFQDTLIFSFSTSHGAGQDNKDVGYYIPLEEIVNFNKDESIIIKSNNKIFEFSLTDKKFIDSITYSFIPYLLSVSNSDSFLHFVNNNVIYSYNWNYKKQLNSFTYPTVISKYVICEKYGKIYTTHSDNKIRYITPDILKPIPDLGFIFDKSLVHTREKIQFNAICNIDSCEYEWQFIPAGIKTKTKSKEIEYEYSQSGTYDVHLTIITPEGERYEFVKEKIIKVIDKPKADFSFEILNDELPLKVQFTDLSKGELIERFWDFGDGNTSKELNPTHEYKFLGDFSVKLIVKDSLDSDTLMRYEELLIGTPLPSIRFALNTILTKKSISEFKNAYLVSGGFIYTSYYYDISTRNRNEILYDYSNRLVFNHFDPNFIFLKKDTIDCGKNEVPFFPKPTSLEVQLDDYRFAIDAKFWEDTYKMIYDSKAHKMDVFKAPQYPYSWIKALVLKNPADDNIFSIFESNNKSEIIVFDFNYDVKSELTLPIANNIFYLADTIDNGLNLFLQKQNKSYLFYSISSENKITYENSILINTAITISGIKSVHENLILLHGYYNDKVNKTTYAYFAKYHPVDNTLQDTILYSRKDIRKIERVINSLYAAIGQSRGRQGYLLLDTNLHQIKDIRVDSLTGEIKDMIFHDKKVYLFTEKIISLPTMSLGAKESYQTTASVLGLPEDIIASVEDSPKIFTDKLTHSAYPNPTNEVLNLKVSTNESANYTIKLYDIFGSEILNIHDGFIPSNSEKIFSIPTSALSIGSYYYVISGGGIVERGKVMVVR